MSDSPKIIPDSPQLNSFEALVIKSCPVPPSELGILNLKENIKEIGRALFSTRYVFALEITALLLTIGVVGAVVLTRKTKSELDPIPVVEPPVLMRNSEEEIELTHNEDQEEPIGEIVDPFPEDLSNDELEVNGE